PSTPLSFLTRRSSDLAKIARVAGVLPIHGLRPLLERGIVGGAQSLLVSENGAVERVRLAGERLPFRRVLNRPCGGELRQGGGSEDRKSTRLNSSHVKI